MYYIFMSHNLWLVSYGGVSLKVAIFILVDILNKPVYQSHFRLDKYCEQGTWNIELEGKVMKQNEIVQLKFNY